MVPIVVDALGKVPKELEKGLEQLEIGGRIETIQTAALLRLVKNTLKSPGALRRHVITHTHSESCS